MIAKRQVQHFRRYQPREEKSWWPVIFCGALIAFNVGLYGYLFLSLFRMWSRA